MGIIKTGLIFGMLIIGSHVAAFGELVTPHPNAIQAIDPDNIIAYPIPASTIVHFAYRAPSDRVITIKIFNTRYKLVNELSADNLSGEGQLSWDISNVAPGIYYYQTMLGDEQAPIKKLVISR